MRPLFLATALLAATAAIPLSANAASYVPAAPTAVVQEAADALRHDVHGREYYRGGQKYRNPLWSFLAPYRYGYAERDHRHDRGYHRGHYKRDWDRERSRHHRRDRKWRRYYDDDFDAHEWNRRQRRHDPGR